MNQPLTVEGNYTATVYSVEPAGDNSSGIVITVATDSSEAPATLTELLIQPLEQMLEEVSDINEQVTFTILSTERHGKYLPCYSMCVACIIYMALQCNMYMLSMIIACAYCT